MVVNGHLNAQRSEASVQSMGSMGSVNEDRERLAMELDSNTQFLREELELGMRQKMGDGRCGGVDGSGLKLGLGRAAIESICLRKLLQQAYINILQQAYINQTTREVSHHHPGWKAALPRLQGVLSRAGRKRSKLQMVMQWIEFAEEELKVELSRVEGVG